MAAPTTLLEFRTQDQDRLALALDGAKKDLANAVTAESTANGAFTNATNDLKARADALDQARRDLSAIPMPADGETLLENMRKALVAWRTAGTQQVEADDTRLQARAERERLARRVATLDERLVAAKAALDAEQKATKKRAELVDAVTAGPLKDLPANAKDASDAFAAGALAKVQGEFKKGAHDATGLLQRARERRKLASILEDDLEDMETSAVAVSAAYDEKNPRAAAKTPRLQREFDAAVAKLQAFAIAKTRVEQARAALKSLNDKAAPTLTAAQKDEVVTSDAALETQRGDALAKLAKRDDAQKEFAKAVADYEKELFDERVKSPDKSDDDLRAADPLKTLFKTRNDKEKALKDAGDDIKPADIDVLQRWFAAVPDALWDDVEALEAANEDLDRIKGTDIANGLVKPVQDAEKALAQNLDEVSRERLLVDDRIAGMLAQREAIVTATREVAVRRVKAATRFMAEV